MWSLGVILIELATGIYPYPEVKTYIDLIQNILMMKEPRLPDNGLYSAEFRDFIELSLQKEPNKRATPAELLVKILLHRSHDYE